MSRLYLSIPSNKNFAVVYRMPLDDELPKSHCFGGGHSVNFQMVDWFNPFPSDRFNKNRRLDLTFEAWIGERNLLTNFIFQKIYFNSHPQNKHLVVCSFNESFIVSNPFCV